MKNRKERRAAEAESLKHLFRVMEQAADNLEQVHDMTWIRESLKEADEEQTLEGRRRYARGLAYRFEKLGLKFGIPCQNDSGRKVEA